METPTTEKPTDTIQAARQTPTGKRLTEAQSEEVDHIVAIMERSIKKTGVFKDKLADQAFAFARTEKFDALRAETIIRDQFKARYGQTMNAMRQDLQTREANLTQSERNMAMRAALNVGTTIAEGETMPFYLAYDKEAVKLSKSLNITEAGAKSLMKEEYKAHQGRDLYADCKEVEKQYHLPKVEAEKQQQKAARAQSKTHSMQR